MKKLILVFIAAIFCSTAYSQFSFGPKVGYNTSELSIDKSEISTDLKNSMQFGIFLRLGNSFYIQPEVNYLIQGGIFKQPSLSGGISPFEQEVELKTIQIPVMIGGKLIDLKAVNLRVFGGPVASIVMETNIENKLDNYIGPITSADISEMIWSIQLGAGIDVLMFTLDVRYNVGLNNIIETVAIAGEDVKFDSKASGFNVSLGWKIF